MSYQMYGVLHVGAGRTHESVNPALWAGQRAAAQRHRARCPVPATPSLPRIMDSRRTLAIGTGPCRRTRSQPGNSPRSSSQARGRRARHQASRFRHIRQLGETAGEQPSYQRGRRPTHQVVGTDPRHSRDVLAADRGRTHSPEWWSWRCAASLRARCRCPRVTWAKRQSSPDSSKDRPGNPALSPSPRPPWTGSRHLRPAAQFPGHWRWLGRKSTGLQGERPQGESAH